MSMEFLLGAVMTIMFFIFFRMFFGGGSEESVEKKPAMKLSPERKRFIAKWMKSMGGPDEDGYMGHFSLPEDVMIFYRRMYPNDWD